MKYRSTAEERRMHYLLKVCETVTCAVLVDVCEWEKEDLEIFLERYHEVIDSIYKGYDRPEKMLEYLKREFDIELEDI